VSTPIGWEEVEAAVGARDAAALEFEMGAVLERVEQHGDRFAAVLSTRQELPR
jgi:DNA primase